MKLHRQKACIRLSFRSVAVSDVNLPSEMLLSERASSERIFSITGNRDSAVRERIDSKCAAIAAAEPPPMKQASVMWRRPSATAVNSGKIPGSSRNTRSEKVTVMFEIIASRLSQSNSQQWGIPGGMRIISPGVMVSRASPIMRRPVPSITYESSQVFCECIAICWDGRTVTSSKVNAQDSALSRHAHRCLLVLLRKCSGV